MEPTTLAIANRVYSKKKRNLARAKKEKNGLRKNKAERKAV